MNVPPGADTTATIAATVLLFTILFDLVDIYPQVRSFAFVRTGTYIVYLFLRLFLAGIAAILITQAQPGQTAFLVGVGAVLGGVVVVQGLALKIAGQDVVNLANLIDTYKITMVTEAAQKALRGRDVERLRLTDDLLDQVSDVRELRQALQGLLLLAYAAADDAAAKVEDYLAKVDMAAGPDEEFRRRLYASQIAQANPDYALELLNRLRKTG